MENDLLQRLYAAEPNQYALLAAVEHPLHRKFTAVGLKPLKTVQTKRKKHTVEDHRFEVKDPKGNRLRRIRNTLTQNKYKRKSYHKLAGGEIKHLVYTRKSQTVKLTHHDGRLSVVHRVIKRH